MAIKLFENISTVQNVPAATSDTPRDRYKPISLYLVGAGTGAWKVTVSYSPINSSVYKKLGPVFTLSVSNTNPFQLFSWDYDADSFVAWVSKIEGSANATLWMTQGNTQNLDYLLMTEPTARLKADPTDIPNCSLEYTPSGWVGNIGIVDNTNVLLSLPTNTLVPGKVSAKVGQADSAVTYTYLSNGWNALSNTIVTSSIPTNPAPNTTYQIDAYPGSRLYTMPDGKLGGTLGVLADYPTAVAIGAAYSAVLGAVTARIPCLAGIEHFGIQYAPAQSRWRVSPGDGCIICIPAPFSIAKAETVTLVSFDIGSLPAGIWGDGETFEICVPITAGASNSGSDTVSISVGGINLLSSPTPIPPNNTYPFLLRFTRLGTAAWRVLTVVGGSVSTGVSSISPNFDGPLQVTVKITPATIDNSVYCRLAYMKKIV